MAGDVYVSFGADTGDLEAAFALAKAETNALSKEMRDLAKEMAATGAGMESELGKKLSEAAKEMVEAKGHLRELGAEMKEHQGEASETGERIDKLREGFMRLAEIAGIEIGLSAFKEWISETTEAAEKIEQVSAKLGVSTDEVQRIGATAKLSGIDFGELQSEMERLQLSLAKIGEKATPASEALKVLGINAREFRSLQINAQIEEMAVAFSKFADGSGKTAAAMALLGRSGADMLPYLNRGKEGIEELNAATERSGVIMSKETVAALAETRDHLNELSLAWTALSQKIFTAANPAIDAATKEITKLVESMNAKDIRAGIESLTDAGIDLSAAIAEYAIRAIDAIDKLIAKLGGLRSAAESLDTFAAAMEGDNAALARVGKGLWGALTGADDGSKDAALAATESLDSKLKAIQQSADAAKAKLHSVMQEAESNPYGSIDAHAFDKPHVPKMDLGGNGKAAADGAAKAFSQEVQAAQDAAKEQATILDGELNTHQITMTQWLAQSKTVLDQETAAVKDAASKALATASLTAQQRKEIASKEQHDLAEINRQWLADQNKAQQESLKAWQTYQNEVNGALTSQISGLLKGTESWSTALKNTLATLTADIVKFFAQWALKQAENVALQLASQNSLTTGLVSALGLQGAAQAAAAKPGILAEIAADTGAAFAGFTAFLAPTIGPAAPGVAAGLAASTNATAMSLAAFDIGAWSIPENQLAMIHKNELVMPAPEAGAFRSMLSTMAGGKTAGASTTHNHVWNIQSNSADPRAVARQIAQLWNSNLSLRPSY